MILKFIMFLYIIYIIYIIKSNKKNEFFPLLLLSLSLSLFLFLFILLHIYTHILQKYICAQRIYKVDGDDDDGSIQTKLKLYLKLHQN